jgi:hypothetical protein
MKKGSKILIFVAAFIGMIIVYYSLFYNEQKRFDWSEQYELSKDKPYGTWLISELLKKYDAPSFKELALPLDQSLKNAASPSNYIFIGGEIYLEENSRDSLLSYVAKGNNAFIFTKAQPYMLLTELLEGVDLDSVYTLYNFAYSDSLINRLDSAYFRYDKEQQVSYIYRNLNTSYYWSYLNDLIVNPQIKKLGSSKAFNENGVEEGVNFYQIDYGEGSFYFHSQPISFTNISLKEEGMLAYTNNVFGLLNEGPIYWEEHNWRFNRPNAKTWLYKPSFFNTGKSPLNFILTNPPLKWAWYLLLFFILLFVIFNGKRRKAIIPLLPDRRNTSLAHLKKMSVLYLNNENHYVICAKMFENFLGFLQNELRINTKQDAKKMVAEIHNKRNIEIEYIQAVFDRWRYIEFSKTANKEILEKFNSELIAFYEQINK